MEELKKLECYLKLNNIQYKRFDESGMYGYNRHQIIVYDENGKRLWDAICHKGSYGYSEGLLEIYGTIVRPCRDSVEGWLTAEDVIERIEEHERSVN